jgi:hypothetical protein
MHHSLSLAWHLVQEGRMFLINELMGWDAAKRAAPHYFSWEETTHEVWSSLVLPCGKMGGAQASPHPMDRHNVGCSSP